MIIDNITLTYDTMYKTLVNCAMAVIEGGWDSFLYLNIGLIFDI